MRPQSKNVAGEISARIQLRVHIGSGYLHAFFERFVTAYSHIQLIIFVFYLHFFLQLNICLFFFFSIIIIISLLLQFSAWIMLFHFSPSKSLSLSAPQSCIVFYALSKRSKANAHYIIIAQAHWEGMGSTEHEQRIVLLHHIPYIRSYVLQNMYFTVAEVDVWKTFPFHALFANANGKIIIIINIMIVIERKTLPHGRSIQLFIHTIFS